MSLTLEQANEEIQRLKDNHKDFLYIVSHDLNQPLRGISTLTSILKEELADVENEEVQEVLNLLRKGTLQMQQMIANLLEISRLHTTNLEKTSVNFNDIIADVIQELNVEHIVIDVEPDLPNSFINAQDAFKICKILIENACIHHVEEHKTLRIYHKVANNCNYYYFSDNGTTIGKKYHDLIWKIFRTVEAPEVGHWGAGLYLLRGLCGKYDGTAMYHPGEDGNGNNIVVKLPVSDSNP